ncbi:MAG: integrase core domain-containing protein [Bacteroidetes bacterium]|nr:integrase core domain-containing protein [Bacteroidota bacterium]
MNFHQAQRLVEESIALYNHKRPHLALAMQTPESIYNQQKSRPLSIVGTS